MNKDHFSLPDAASMRHLLFTHLDIHQGQNIYIALSGGVDSIVLTHLLAQYREQFQSDLNIIALHFDHGLNSQSQDWRQFCEAFCEKLQIEFHYQRQPIQAKKQHSLEALARQARYAFFEQSINRLSQNHPAILCTAHHQNDQSETVLLSLSKGAHTLPVIRRKRRLSSDSPIQLMRPLLDFSRDAIEKYAKDNHLEYIEDPSNQSRGFDRNFLRHEVIPLLSQRFTSWTANLARIANVWQARHDWQQQYFDTLIHNAQDDQARTLACQTAPLPLLLLKQYNRQFSHDLLNYWLEKNGFGLPSYQQIDEWLNQIDKQQSGYASIVTPTYQLQYYQGHLYLLSNKKLQALQTLSNQQYITLNPPQSYITDVYRITFVEGNNAIGKCWLNANWQIRYGRNNASMQLPGRPNKTLKNLFQEKHIPRWMRDILPLVYIDGRLAFVPGVGISERFIASGMGIKIVLV